MRIRKRILRPYILFISTAVVITLLFVSYGLSQSPSERDTDEKKTPPPILGIEEPKDAGQFFKEAQRLAPNDPMGAIMLYQRGLILKPDAWAERRQLAALYESQRQLDLAISEYEAVNKATGSKESFEDLIRVMGQAGFFHSAATLAQKAYERYPDPHLLYLAGELFWKYRAEKDAVNALEEYLKLKPDDAKAYLLLGSIYEYKGDNRNALRTYLKAKGLAKENKDLLDALRRIQAETITIEGLTIFLPRGWLPIKDGLMNIEEGHRVTLSVATGGDVEAIVLEKAKGAVPGGPFTDEALKSYEEFKRMQEEIAKTDPELAKQIRPIPVPSITKRDVPGLAGAKMVLISQGETPYPGMESVITLAIPSGGKIYTMTWQAARPIEDGEKVLMMILKQALWPM